VGLTRELRRDGQISEDLVVIYNLGQGSYYALDTAKVGADGEAPVVGFTPGLNSAGDELEVIAPNFGRFFWTRSGPAWAAPRAVRMVTSRAATDNAVPR
jgi:SMI1/KNR4 family protein SUKH-1